MKDFDKLTAKTKTLHVTRRKTQPWKAGLPIDWRPAERFRLFPPAAWVMRARRKLFGEYAFLGNYKPHPDRNQENFFFGLLKECLDEGLVTEEYREYSEHVPRLGTSEILAKPIVQQELKPFTLVRLDTDSSQTIIDTEGKLAYMGGIDSVASARASDIEKATQYVPAALAQVMAGKAADPSITRPYGCSVKY